MRNRCEADADQFEMVQDRCDIGARSTLGCDTGARCEIDARRCQRGAKSTMKTDAKFSASMLDIDASFIIDWCNVDAKRRIVDANKCESMRYRYKAGASRRDIGASSLRVNASRSNMMPCLRGPDSKSMRSDAMRIDAMSQGGR